MTRHLDPRFAKIVALMNSTEHEGEKQAARKRAEAVAASCGMTLDEAVKACSQPVVEKSINFMDGWDDWCEQREPGYKAKQAVEKQRKAEERHARLTVLLDRYGSKEAILAPCEKEQLLHAALKPWIKYCKPPLQRWTYSVDGSGATYLGDVSDRVRVAVAAAYPLPTTLAEAMEEFRYWQNREIEIKDALDDEYGDERLDRPALFRMEIVRNLIETELRLTTVKDVVARFAFYRERMHGEYRNEKTEDAIFRDLEAMAQAENDLSTATVQKRRRKGWTAPIAEMLRVNPNCSDRRIARSCRVSPTTVGKVRASLGLQQGVRAVKRSGQMYEMKMSNSPRES